MHPIALREFRYSLTKEEEEELVQLVELKMRCSDPHIVKPLGALQSGMVPQPVRRLNLVLHSRKHQTHITQSVYMPCLSQA